jgi:hypothetical protein
VNAPRVSLLRRALWHANRTKLAWVVKGLASAVRFKEKASRREARRSYVADAGATACAAELASNGYTFVTALIAPEVLGELERESLQRVARAGELSKQQALTHKAFWVRLLDEDILDGAFDCDNAFVRMALQPRLVAMLGAYIGELPRLMDVLLTYSTPSDEPLSYSQLWHKDFDDVKTLKVFVYLTDVSQHEDGPFTFLPGPASDRVGFTLRSHLSDDEFFKRARRDETMEIRAPRLAAFVCETSRCFHMGSRVHAGHARLMYTATFISSPNVYPENAPRFRALRAIGAEERLLLGL